MKSWQKAGIAFLAVVLIGGVYLFFVFKSRQDPGVLGKKNQEPKMTQDELAVVRLRYATNFTDAKDALEGKPAWIKAGYVLPYFPYSGGSVQWQKRVGELPPATKINITKLIKASVPAKIDDRVAHGIKQYLAVFTMDGSDGTYAAPVGATDGPNESILADELFYYDPPQKIYDNWPQPTWDAIKAHTPTVGMNELQTRMAVGAKVETDSQDAGNRTITYHAGPKTWTVSFSKDKATSVKAS